MKENQVQEKLVEQTEALDIIAKELRWMLDESTKRNIQPDTPIAEEMLQRFFSLYKDFLKVRQDTIKLAVEIHRMKFTDRTMGMVYRATADLLVRKTGEGIFEQFTSVAEHGCLPDGTTFDDLSS